MNNFPRMTPLVTDGSLLNKRHGTFKYILGVPYFPRRLDVNSSNTSNATTITSIITLTIIITVTVVPLLGLLCICSWAGCTPVVRLHSLHIR